MKNKKEIPSWAKTGHQKPVTRREFLAHGLIPFAAYAVAPTLLNLLSSSQASAAGCPTSGSSLIPLITVNLRGGPSLSGQVIVKTTQGMNLTSYSKLGLGNGPNSSILIEKEFGNVEFAGRSLTGNNPNNQTGQVVSQFLQGLRLPRNNATVRNAALDKTAFVYSCVQSGDDTANNAFDITGLAMKLGMAGERLPNLGTSDTATGISQQKVIVPPPAPFVVNNTQDLINALGYNKALSSMSDQQKSTLARLISKLTSEQTRRIATTQPAVVVKDLIDCAGVKNVNLIETKGGNVAAFDSTANTYAADLVAIWNDNAANGGAVTINNNSQTSQNAVFGAMVFNGIIGNAATINLDMTGYDYHDSDPTNGDAKDLAAGRVVGKILETAALLNRPVFVYVCADGATVSSETAGAERVWVSDRGIAGMQYMFAFDPAGRPATTNFQIGGFTNSQAADAEFPTGNSAEAAAQAIFANYAVLNKRRDFLDANRILNADILTQVLKFT